MLGYGSGLWYKRLSPVDPQKIEYSAKAIDITFKYINAFTRAIEPLTRMQRSVVRGRIGVMDCEILDGDRIVIDEKKYVVTAVDIKPNPANPGRLLYLVTLEG